MQIFAAIARSTAEISRGGGGGIIPPPPSLSSLQNSPVFVWLSQMVFHWTLVPLKLHAGIVFFVLYNCTLINYFTCILLVLIQHITFFIKLKQRLLGNKMKLAMFHSAFYEEKKKMAPFAPYRRGGGGCHFHWRPYMRCSRKKKTRKKGYPNQGWARNTKWCQKREGKKWEKMVSKSL